MAEQNRLPDDHEYLSNLYNQLWNNLVGAEGRFLQFLGFYGVALGLLLGAAPDHIPLGASTITIILASVWAAHVAIDANHWAQRNHALVARVENRMAQPDLLGFLFPPEYRTVHYGVASIYQIHLTFFVLISVLAVLRLFGESEPDLQSIAVAITALLIGVLTVIWRYYDYKQSFRFYESNG